MTNSKNNVELANFDIKEQFANLLHNSQDTIYQYDTLLSQIQSIVENSNSPDTTALNDIINSYYIRIEANKHRIYTTKRLFERFNEIYDITQQLNNYYHTEQKVLKGYNKILKQIV